MKNNLIVKFIAIFLTACALVLAISCGVAISSIESAGLYVNSLDELQDQQYNAKTESIALSFARLYAVETYGNMSYTMRQDFYDDPDYRADRQYWTLSLSEGDTLLVEPRVTSDQTVVRKYTYTPKYPIVSLYDPRSINDPEEEDSFVPEGYLYSEPRAIWEGTQLTVYYFYYYEAPEYTITVYMQPEILESSSFYALTAVYPLRYNAIGFLVMGILLFAAGMAFLCWSAGRTDEGDIRLGGLNRLPLDIYTLILGIVFYFLYLYYQNLIAWINNNGPHMGNLTLLCVDIWAMTVLCISLVFAFAAQVKLPNNYWWFHTCVGSALRKFWIFLRFCGRNIIKLIDMIPVIWQWLLTTAILLISYFIIHLFTQSHPGMTWLFVFPVIATLSTVSYWGYAVGVLFGGAKKMASGDLSHKINTKYLSGSFREFGEQLNTLSETAVQAADQQMQSERMKTELITNVSHDIKTPLTSIINFVDLLQKPHTEKEQAEYLDVLSRQATRMKKLIEDLVELNKASTGNMSADLVALDATEAVNQALGEFSDVLSAAHLTPIFNAPTEPAILLADGKLLWRVLSNLFSNAVKYAMPGTRLYIQLQSTSRQVILTIKNVSREELRVSVEELLERFVQGDESRNTEGSGLGLNIAKSLMEVQKGHMELRLDGDIFQVTLFFRKV